MISSTVCKSQTNTRASQKYYIEWHCANSWFMAILVIFCYNWASTQSKTFFLLITLGRFPKTKTFTQEIACAVKLLLISFIFMKLITLFVCDACAFFNRQTFCRINKKHKQILSIFDETTVDVLSAGSVHAFGQFNFRVIIVGSINSFFVHSANVWAVIAQIQWHRIN